MHLCFTFLLDPNLIGSRYYTAKVTEFLWNKLKNKLIIKFSKILKMCQNYFYRIKQHFSFGHNTLLYKPSYYFKYIYFCMYILHWFLEHFMRLLYMNNDYLTSGIRMYMTLHKLLSMSIFIQNKLFTLYRYWLNSKMIWTS